MHIHQTSLTGNWESGKSLESLDSQFEAILLITRPTAGTWIGRFAAKIIKLFKVFLQIIQNTNLTS